MPLLREDAMNGGCRVDVFNEAGFLYATRDAGPHDWRLFSRAEQLEYEFTDYERAYENALITSTGWKETWYCTRCRLVEEREVPCPD
jgi:hypothetical protein